MRPLKFRQYYNGKFHYWGYVDKDDTFTSPVYGESQQFTGLLDKQGKEIYEGDCVKTPGGQILPIVVDCITDGDAKFRRIRLKECEVIGNVGENPELIEREKEEARI